MENEPTISVLMPVYNGKRFLHQAIESILNQSYTNFEFIIINDGSTDTTEEIILSYNDPRIVYVKNEHNLKLIKTLNKGIGLAKGKYIARMDADDISSPDRFDKQIAIFNSNSKVDIVNALAYHLDEDGKNFREQRFALSLSNEAIKCLIPLQNFICHPLVMVKTSLIEKYKYTDSTAVEHIEDFDLWNRMLTDDNTCYTIPECLLFYRDNGVSINHTQKDKQVERMYKLCQSILKNRFDFEIDEQYFNVLLDETKPTGYGKLSSINKILIAYNKLMKVKCNISASAFKEIDLWRKKKIIFIALKSFSNSGSLNKIGILMYLFGNGYWLINKDIQVSAKKIVAPISWKMTLNFSK